MPCPPNTASSRHSVLPRGSGDEEGEEEVTARTQPTGGKSASPPFTHVSLQREDRSHSGRGMRGGGPGHPAVWEGVACPGCVCGHQHLDSDCQRGPFRPLGGKDHPREDQAWRLTPECRTWMEEVVNKHPSKDLGLHGAGSATAEDHCPRPLGLLPPHTKEGPCPQQAFVPPSWRPGAQAQGSHVVRRGPSPGSHMREGEGELWVLLHLGTHPSQQGSALGTYSPPLTAPRPHLLTPSPGS